MLIVALTYANIIFDTSINISSDKYSTNQVGGSHICVDELTTLIYTVTIKNLIIFIILLYWISKFIFIILFLFSYFNFYVDCICSGIMVVYKLVF
jgi:hypothetical protein